MGTNPKSLRVSVGCQWPRQDLIGRLGMGGLAEIANLDETQANT
jgi:hypothetical protein